MTIDELLVDFDEMGFAPTTLCENPDEYACKWKMRLLTEIERLTRECNQQAETLAKEQEACVECGLEQSWELFWRDKEIDRLRAESKRFENNMKSVLEIEKKNAVKEFSKKLKARITRFIGRHDLSVRFFIDIMSDLLKGYEE